MDKSMPIKFVDYGYIMPGQKTKVTTEDRERLKRTFDELKKIAIERGIAFVIVKGDEQ